MSPVVYFITQSDHPGQVKIGTTVNLEERMARLGRDHQVTLLAVEPGGRMTELNRHTRFAPMRRDGDWFTFGAPIIAHVMELDQVPVVMTGERYRMPVTA